MPPEKGDAAYLWDMLDAARAVRDFTTGRTFHDYLGDQMLRRAVERSVEIIGEAAGRVSEALQDAHPEIPWRRGQKPVRRGLNLSVDLLKVLRAGRVGSKTND